MLTLFCGVRLPDEQTIEVEASGETYDGAWASLNERVPDGGMMLGVSRWPTHLS